MLLIGVIGASSDDEEYNRLAFEVGRLIAKRGAALICGGLGGVMHNVCWGAKEAGGLTIGVLPSAGKEDANPHVDIPIVTGMSWARNVIIVNSADALVAVGGSHGTLSEIAHALNIGKKVFALKSWEEIQGQEDYVVAGSPEEAVELAFEYARTRTAQ
jgi:uncharacterized protein (TIGR00725 family)